MSTSPLEYAPPPRGVNGRRWIRRTILLLLLCALLFFIVNREEIVQHATLLQAQRRAMNHIAPPNQLVFTTDPDQAKKLAASSSGYVRTNGDGPAARPEPVWKNYLQLVGESYRPEATVFCHEMCTPSGRRFVVALNLSYRGPWNNIPILFGATMIDPATITAKPQTRISSLCDISYQTMIMAIRKTQIFAGQIDPGDSSHFSIPYQIDGQPGIMDAYLKDDQRLHITIRTGPATRVLSENQMIKPQ